MSNAIATNPNPTAGDVRNGYPSAEPTYATDPAGPTHDAVGYLADRTDRLEQGVDDLARRLSPVLSLADPTPPDSPTVAVENRSLITNQITRQGERIDQLTDRIAVLIARLEV